MTFPGLQIQILKFPNTSRLRQSHAPIAYQNQQGFGKIQRFSAPISRFFPDRGNPTDPLPVPGFHSTKKADAPNRCQLMCLSETGASFTTADGERAAELSSLAPKGSKPL